MKIRVKDGNIFINGKQASEEESEYITELLLNMIEEEIKKNDT